MGFAHLDRYADRPSWLTRRTTPTQRLSIAIAAAFAAGLMPPGAWRALLVLFEALQRLFAKRPELKDRIQVVMSGPGCAKIRGLPEKYGLEK